jgi:hypothetical protein
MTGALQVTPGGHFLFTIIRNGGMYNRSIMQAAQIFPSFDDHFSDLDQFILSLVDSYRASNINSWEELETSVKVFFNPARMEQMETLVPGWRMMASYTEGITLVHVMCVFLGMYMLPEYKQLTAKDQDLMKWIILFHDSAKIHIEGKKDAMHAFRSAVLAANTLPKLGFRTTENYLGLINSWSESTIRACTTGPHGSLPDNQKLPEILAGMSQLFGSHTAAILILKAVLLHISLPVDAMYPTPAPLTEAEIRAYVDDDLFPLLRVMMLADNEGWSMFHPETRTRQRIDTLAAFEEVRKLISQ